MRGSPVALSQQTRYKTPVLVLLLTLAVSACTSKPIIDTQGVNMAGYERDLADCEAYADQVQVAGKAAGGAAAGAVVGAVIGAAVGNSHPAGRAAGAGAAVGASKGTGRGLHERERVVRNCLRHRGYTVLN